MTAPTFAFTPATRRAKPARIAIDGPSGSGKTWTALAFATTLGTRVALADTEHESALLYAGDGPGEFTFDHCPLDSYDPAIIPDLLVHAASSGHDVLVIDSLTHFWSGVDGMLEQVDRAGARSRGNTFGGWRDMRPVERRMVEALLGFPGHLVVTMRSKTEYVIEENDRGKKEPKKVGLKPDQREGIEYEFDLVGSLDVEHTFTVTKSRCSAYTDAVIPRPDGATVIALRDWLAGGAAAPSAAEFHARALALDDFGALGGLFGEVTAAGLAGAFVLDAGRAVALGEFIKVKGQRLRSRSRPVAVPDPASDGPDRDPETGEALPDGVGVPIGGAA